MCSSLVDFRYVAKRNDLFLFFMHYIAISSSTGRIIEKLNTFFVLIAAVLSRAFNFLLQLARCEERLGLVEQSLASTQDQLSARVSEVRKKLIAWFFYRQVF